MALQPPPSPPAIPDEAAKRKFPDGWRTINHVSALLHNHRLT
jgi:hypothetical protein